MHRGAAAHAAGVRRPAPAALAVPVHCSSLCSQPRLSRHIIARGHRHSRLWARNVAVNDDIKLMLCTSLESCSRNIVVTFGLRKGSTPARTMGRPHNLCRSPTPSGILGGMTSPSATDILPQHEALTCVQHWPLAEMTDDGQQLPLTSITPAQVGGISQNRPRWPGLHVQTPALQTPCSPP